MKSMPFIHLAIDYQLLVITFATTKQGNWLIVTFKTDSIILHLFIFLSD